MATPNLVKFQPGNSGPIYRLVITHSNCKREVQMSVPFGVSAASYLNSEKWACPVCGTQVYSSDVDTARVFRDE